MKFVYADNAATTAVSKTALTAMLPYLRENYGNPSSVYGFGRRSAEALSKAREEIAACLNAGAREIFFTSGGSEADNQALLSSALAGERKGKKHIVSTAFEHHAVLHSLTRLQKQGFEVTLVKPGSDGIVRPEDVAAALREDTCLVSVMLANNEIGTVQPVREIGALCRERGVHFHSDAVQAVGHIPVDVQALQVDYLALSGHKFHAPKGVGALYVRRGLPLTPLIEGGGQERGKRSGTENVAGIVGMAAALRESCEHMEENARRITAMRERLIESLSAIPHSCLNGSRTACLPGTLSLCFEGVPGDELLLLLDQSGICASTGSACSAGSLDPSHVLLSLGVPYELARGSLRLSIGEYNTMEEMDHIAKTLPRLIAALRSDSPVWHDLESGKKPHCI